MFNTVLWFIEKLEDGTWRTHATRLEPDAKHEWVKRVQPHSSVPLDIATLDACARMMYEQEKPLWPSTGS